MNSPHEGMSVDELLSLEAFKLLPKVNRKAYLGQARKYLYDSLIREHWGLNYSSFRYQLSALNLLGQEDRIPELTGRPPRAASGPSKPGKSRKGKGKAENKQGGTPPPRREINPDDRTYIDADYEVMEETAIATHQAPGASETAATAQSEEKRPTLAYDLEDAPAALRDRLIAIANLVAVETGPVRLKIEIYR